MDVLKRINNLRESRGWTVYKLAEEAGITQSTLSNMFSRNTLPSLSTLEQICNAFEITLANFFSDEEKLDNDTQIAIAKYQRLNKRDKEIVKCLMDDMYKQITRY